MAITFTTRWRRFGAATAVCAALVGVAACSDSSSNRAAPAGPANFTSASASPVLDDPAAVAAVSRAIAASNALRSYAFRSEQILRGGPRDQRTVLVGRAIRPSSVVYTLTGGATSQQVVRVGGRTFLRVPPAGWKALKKALPTVDPIATLLPLLSDLQSPRLIGGVLTGSVPAAALSKSGLAPRGSAPAGLTPVTMRLDNSGRVVSVALSLTVQAGAKRLQLNGTTSFSGFNAAPAIRPPGVVVG